MAPVKKNKNSVFRQEIKKYMDIAAEAAHDCRLDVFLEWQKDGSVKISTVYPDSGWLHTQIEIGPAKRPRAIRQTIRCGAKET